MTQIDLFNFMPASGEDISALNKLVNSAYRGESSKKGWCVKIFAWFSTKSVTCLWSSVSNVNGVGIILVSIYAFRD